MPKSRPYFVGIAGGTGSGKTTVATKLLEALPGDGAVIIDHDAYYKDRSGMPKEERDLLNFDHPDALDNDLLVRHLDELRAGRPIEMPLYDFVTHSRRADTRHVKPAPVTVVEGILVFVDPAVRRLLDIKIFVDTDADIRLIRRIKRDIAERGRTLDSVVQQYEATVRPTWSVEFLARSVMGQNLVAASLSELPTSGFTTFDVRAFWQLTEGVRGLADACRALGLPVTGGNVSLYNESPRGRIAPTPEIGVVGLLDDVSTLVGPAFAHDGDTIVLIGDSTPGLAGSAYAELAGATSDDGPPDIDLAREAAVQRFIREAIRRGLVASAQDVSGGGLAVALAECSIWSDHGARVRLALAGSPAVDLFGESTSRLVVTADRSHEAVMVLLARQHGLPVEAVGTVGGDRLVIESTGAGAVGAAEERGGRVADALDVPIADLRHAWDHGLARALGWDAPAGAAR